MLTTVRDLLELLPRPGIRIHHITNAIFVQALTLAMVAMHSLIGTVTMVVLAIIQMLFIHVAAAQRQRTLVLEHVAREHALRAELAEANTDAVTGLPTRRLMYQRLNAAPADTAVTVAFCDADGLKAINDQLSHAVGDEYLAVIAQRLSRIVLPGDIVVRLGGDEFAIVTSQSPNQLASGIGRELHVPAVVAGYSMPVRFSTGIFATTGGDAHTALGCAEAAMRTAKQRRSLIERYDPIRDGMPIPAGVRPTIRRRDQRPEPPVQQQP